MKVLKKLLAPMLLALLPMMSACGDGYEEPIGFNRMLIGTWKWDDSGQYDIVTMQRNGKFTWENYCGENFTLSAEGTYDLAPSTITFHYKNVKVDSRDRGQAQSECGGDETTSITISSDGNTLTFGNSTKIYHKKS